MYRLLSVVYEVLASAARVKNALWQKGFVPKICENTDGSKGKIELTLFVDKDIVLGLSEHDLETKFKCLFDRVIYYDDLPSIVQELHMLSYKRLHMLVRLGPRTNVMKMLAFLSSPYRYTLYLDGDTSPCFNFQDFIFPLLSQYDVVSSPNPFGYESTFGRKTYNSSPPEKDFANFWEVNGGVLGFQRNNQTQQLIIRALELVPHFASLGFDQDQAMLRHALFESIRHYGLKLFRGEMKHFCRYGWTCDKNSCASGCVMIHQRRCVDQGLPIFGTEPSLEYFKRNRIRVARGTHVVINGLNCSELWSSVEKRAKHYNARNVRLNVDNRKKGRAKVLSSQL